MSMCVLTHNPGLRAARSTGRSELWLGLSLLNSDLWSGTGREQCLQQLLQMMDGIMMDDATGDDRSEVRPSDFDHFSLLTPRPSCLRTCRCCRKRLHNRGCLTNHDLQNNHPRLGKLHGQDRNHTNACRQNCMASKHSSSSQSHSSPAYERSSSAHHERRDKVKPHSKISGIQDRKKAKNIISTRLLQTRAPPGDRSLGTHVLEGWTVDKC
ncbi:uncharacterized protein IWZ02DRAFT_203205 [Phyllosticta citriasiana]|uniref:C2H2-type domain-containing protein n=1 Tax=Phyllosticta citriasiana TaxID=595635 RepID=A0ABR1KLZ9_9PEZI